MANSFPGKKRGEIVLKSKTVVVWVLESWTEVGPPHLSSLENSSFGLSNLCSRSLSSSCFFLAPKAFCRCFFAAESFGWPFRGGLQSRTWAGAAQQIKSWTPLLAVAQGFRCWYGLRECVTAPNSLLLLPPWTPVGTEVNIPVDNWVFQHQHLTI